MTHTLRRTLTRATAVALTLTASAMTMLAQTKQDATTAIERGHIRYVATYGTYNNSGRNWANAKNNIQDAINDLVSSKQLPGEVWVAEGVYTPTETTESGSATLYTSFKVPAGVTVRGGFHGPSSEGANDGETSLNDREVAYYKADGTELKKSDNKRYTLNDNAPTEDYVVKRFARRTVLSGDLSSRAATFKWNEQRRRYITQFYGNSYHVLWFAMNGFDSNGRARALNTKTNGPAMVEGVYVQNGYAKNVELNGHPHNAYGGGAYMVKGSKLQDVWFTQCEASRDGGAVYMDGGGEVERVYVTNSQAMGVGTSWGYGGGICLETNPDMKKLVEKTVTDENGKNTTVSEEQDDPDNIPATTGIHHSYVSACAARMGGGIAIKTSKTSDLDQTDQRNKAYAFATVVAHNVATVEGGGVYTLGGGALSQMTIVRNACYGSGSTIGGVAQGRTGGMYARDKVVLQNSVLWGNYTQNNRISGAAVKTDGDPAATSIQFANSMSAVSDDTKARLTHVMLSNNDYTDWSTTVKSEVSDLSTDNNGYNDLEERYPKFNTPNGAPGHPYAKATYADGETKTVANTLEVVFDPSDATTALKLPYYYGISTSSALVNAGIFSYNLDRTEKHEAEDIYPFDYMTTDVRGNNYSAYATIGAYNSENYTTGLIHANETTTTEGDKTVHHIFVDPSMRTGNEDSGKAGATWTTALRHLGNALEYVKDQTGRSANNVYRIHVKQGEVNTNNSFSHTTNVRNLSFDIPSYCEIYGGYSEEAEDVYTDDKKTTFDLATTLTNSTKLRNPILYPTMLTGVTVNNAYYMNSLHLITISGEAEGVVVDGVTLQYANAKSLVVANTTSDLHYGAGILMTDNSQATFRNMFIKGNTATQGAAAWLGGSSRATFDNVVIYNNEASGSTTSNLGAMIYTEGSASVDFTHGDVLHNVGYAGWLVGTNARQHYTNSIFHANMPTAVDDYRDYTDAAAAETKSNTNTALPSFAYQSEANGTMDTKGIPGAHDKPSDKGLSGTYCFFDAKSAHYKNAKSEDDPTHNFDDLTAKKAYANQYSLSYVFDTKKPENGYPRFVNATRNVGVSTAGDVTFYGRDVSFEPHNMNPIVNAASTGDIAHTSATSSNVWGTDLSTQVNRDYGGLPDVGAIENHVSTEGVNAYADGQPAYGGKIYVRDYRNANGTVDESTTDRDGLSWANAINGNGKYNEIIGTKVPATPPVVIASDASDTQASKRFYLYSTFGNLKRHAVIRSNGYLGHNAADWASASTTYGQEFILIKNEDKNTYGNGDYFIYAIGYGYLQYADDNFTSNKADAVTYSTSNATRASWYLLRVSDDESNKKTYIIPGNLAKQTSSRRLIHLSAKGSNCGIWAAMDNGSDQWELEYFDSEANPEIIYDIISTYDNGLQHALNKAKALFDADYAKDVKTPNREVWVGAGTYDTNNEAQLTMMEGADVLGGFPKTGNPGKDERNISNDEKNAKDYMTTIKPQEGNRGVSQDDDFAERTNSKKEKVYTMFEGFTITGAYTKDATYGAGARIKAYGMLKNCLIKNNTYESTNVARKEFDGGGGIHITKNGLVKNCIIRQNLAFKPYSKSNLSTIRAGGVYCDGGELQNSLIVENMARNGSNNNADDSNVLGAGIYINSKSKLYNCTVAYNVAIKSNNGVDNSKVTGFFDENLKMSTQKAVSPGVWEGGFLPTTSTDVNDLTDEIKNKWPRTVTRSQNESPNNNFVIGYDNEKTSDYFNCIFWGNVGNGNTYENVLQVAMPGYTQGAGFDPDHMYSCYSSAINKALATDKVTANTVYEWKEGDVTVTGTAALETLRQFLNDCHNNSPFKGDKAGIAEGELTYELKDDGNGKYCINMGSYADMIQGSTTEDYYITVGSTETKVKGKDLTEDIAGAARVQDCAIDKGAYEFNGAASITPQTFEAGKYSKDITDPLAVYYVTQLGHGVSSANSPENAACAEKLQLVLDAAGRYKFLNPDTRVIVKVAAGNNGFTYYATHSTRQNQNDVRLYSIMVPRGVEMWGGYSDKYTSAYENGFYNAYKEDGETLATANSEIKSYTDQRDVVVNKTVLDATYTNSDTKAKVTTYHVLTFTDRIYDTNRVPYTKEDIKGNKLTSSSIGNAEPQSQNGNYYSLSTKLETLGNQLGRAVVDGIYAQGGKADIAIVNTSQDVLNPNRYGGVAIVKDYAHVRNCVLEGNEAINGGALALLPGALVSGTLMKGNTATENGGAIYVFQEGNKVNLMEDESYEVRTIAYTKTVTTTTDDGQEVSKDEKVNPVADGDTYDSVMPHVITSTIVNNTATRRGGGVYFTTSEPNVRFSSTVIWQNTANDMANIYGLYNPASLANSAGSDNSDANVSMEYYPFSYSAAQQISLSGLNNISLNAPNSNGARFIKSTQDFKDWTEAARGKNPKPKEQESDPQEYYEYELEIADQDPASAADYSDYGLYGLSNYSLLVKAGMPTNYYKSQYVEKYAASLVDLMSVPRTQKHHSDATDPAYIDIGARAYLRETPSGKLMLRLFVADKNSIDWTAANLMQKLASTTTDITITEQGGSTSADKTYSGMEKSDLRTYYSQVGSSFAYPMQTLQQALDYIRTQRTPASSTQGSFPIDKNANDMQFQIILAGGEYRPRRGLESEDISANSDETSNDNNNLATTRTFNIPEGVSIIGGYNLNQTLYQANSGDDTYTLHDNAAENAVGYRFLGAYNDPDWKDPSNTENLEDGNYLTDYNLKPRHAAPWGSVTVQIDGTTIVLDEVRIDSLNERRELMDLNGNHIIEPWEFKNQTVLQGAVTGINAQGVHHVVTVTADEQQVGALPTAMRTYASGFDNNDYVNDGYHSKMVGQYVTLDGLTIEGGRARGWDPQLAHSVRRFGYYHGGAVMVDGNLYANSYNEQAATQDGYTGNLDGVTGRKYMHSSVSNSIAYRDIPLAVMNCKFDNNQAGYGGAISSNGTLTVMSSTFERNRAVGGSDPLSNVAFSDKGITVQAVADDYKPKGETKTALSEVTYPGHGGAIYATKDLKAYNTVFANNEAMGSDNVNSTDYTKIECRQMATFRRNTQSTGYEMLGAGGAVVMGRQSHFHIINCNIVKNQANAMPAVYTLNPNTKANKDMGIDEYNQFFNTVAWGNRVNPAVANSKKPWGSTIEANNTDTIFKDRLLFNVGLMVNLNLLTESDLKDKTGAVISEDAKEHTATDFNNPARLSDINAPTKAEEFFDSDGKRRYAETAWFSAYEPGRYMPAQRDYVGYRDMPAFDMTKHIIAQIADLKGVNEDAPMATYYMNCNVEVSEINDADSGPNFGNPSTTPGYEGWVENADWSPSRINGLTDTGSGSLPQSVTTATEAVDLRAYFGTYDEETKTYTYNTDEAKGIYPAAKYKNPARAIRTFLPIADMRYMIAQPESGNEYALPRFSLNPAMGVDRNYVDIGVYEYHHTELKPTSVDEVDILWVATEEKSENGEPDGSTWDKPTTDLQRAIETLLSSRNGHRKEIRLMEGEYAPVYTINDYLAFYINTLRLNESTILPNSGNGKGTTGLGVRSLTIKGGYHSEQRGTYDVEENRAIIRQRERNNTTSKEWNHLFYIDDPTQRYGRNPNDAGANYVDGNGWGQWLDDDHNIRTIPIEFYGVTLQNDQAQKGVQGSVIYYADAIGYNSAEDAKKAEEKFIAGEEPTSVPEIKGTIAASITYAENTAQSGDPDNWQSRRAETQEGELPKLILGAVTVYDSGNEEDTDLTSEDTKKAGNEKSSAVYIGKRGGTTLLYNMVMHSNKTHPLISRGETRMVNSTIALNDREVVINGAGQEVDAENNTAANSRVFNSVFWRNNAKTAEPTSNDGYDKQIKLYGYSGQDAVTDDWSAVGTNPDEDNQAKLAKLTNVFEYNNYTGGVTQYNDYTETETTDSEGNVNMGNVPWRHFNTGLAFDNTDIMNGPNFVLPLAEDPADRDFDINPSQRLLNKGSKLLYVTLPEVTSTTTGEGEQAVTTYKTVEDTKKNANLIYDLSWVQTEDKVGDDEMTVVLDRDLDMRNVPHFDAATRTRINSDLIENGAYEYQTAMRRVLYVNTKRLASTGESWEKPLGSIQQAIDMAALYHSTYTDEQAFVFVKATSPEEDGSLVHTNQDVTLREGVSIYGGMASNAKDIPSKYDESTKVTYYLDSDITEYLDSVDTYHGRIPVAALGFNKTAVQSIRTSDLDFYSSFDHENKVVWKTGDAIPEGKQAGDIRYTDDRLRVQTLIDGFAVMPGDAGASASRPVVYVNPDVKRNTDGTVPTTTLTDIKTVTATNTKDGKIYRVEMPVKDGGNKVYEMRPAMALKNIIVAGYTMASGQHAAYIDNALIYNSLLRDNTTSGGGRTLKLGAGGYAVSITATGVTEGAPLTEGGKGNTDLNNLNEQDGAYTRTYNYGGTYTETKRLLESNLTVNPDHVWFSLTNFDGTNGATKDEVSTASLIKDKYTIHDANGKLDPNMDYQHMETSAYITLDNYDVFETMVLTNGGDGKKYNSDEAHQAMDGVKKSDDGEEGWDTSFKFTDLLSMSNPKNFLPLNLRHYVNLREDFDIMGNPRCPSGVTGANGKLDRGCFQTWWIRSTVETDEANGFYPHPGSVVYLQNRYAVHPAHANNDPTKIYNDANTDISLSLDCTMEPGVLLMQEGTSLYTNGHQMRTNYMAFDKTVSVEKGSMVAMPFAMDYGAEGMVWDVTNYGESVKGKLFTEVDKERASKDVFYGYNSTARSDWQNVFEAENSSKWTRLIGDDLKREAAYGVFMVPQGDVNHANNSVADEKKVRTYRFIAQSTDGNPVYAEEDGETSKAVVLKQQDDYSSTSNGADFTASEDMGWNLIGLPYAVNTYHPHLQVATDIDKKAMHAPHRLWVYFDGELALENVDMVKTNDTNKAYAALVETADETKKSRGGYHEVKAWSSKWEDWNQTAETAQLIGSYVSGGKVTNTDGTTTYTFDKLLRTAEVSPRLWTGEAFFTQTATVYENEKLYFARPVYPGREVDEYTPNVTATYDAKGVFVSKGTVSEQQSGKAKATRAATADSVQTAALPGALSSMLREHYGVNYRMYGAVSYLPETIDEVVPDEGGLSIWASGRMVYISGLQGGESISIYDATGRMYNMLTAPGGTYRTAMPVAGMYVVKVDETVKKVVVR